MIQIKPYQETNKDDLIKLFLELQTFEKQFYPDRTEPTQELGEKLIQELVEDAQTQQGVILLAYDQTTPCGYIAGHVDKESENQHDYFNITDLMVSEKYRARGIGKQLMQQIEAFAKSIGQVKIGVGVLAGNDHAYQVYKKFGFVDYGIEMIKDL